MNRPILKVAVIGLGRIAWHFHIPEIVRHPGFILDAVIDPMSERLREAMDQFHPEGSYLSCDEMYAQRRPDLVVVASPTLFHKQQVLQAFAHGCDVFCEKPLALSLEEVDEIIAAMRKSGRRLMVYQPHRMSPETLVIKAIQSEGWLGEIYLMKHSVTKFDRRSDWQAFAKNGGGMLNNYGAHFIDQFLYLNGFKIDKVCCEMRAVATLGDAEDVVKVVLAADDGVLMDLDINMAASQNLTPWFIAGDCGSAIYDPDAEEWKVTYFNPDDLSPVRPREELAAAERTYGSGERIEWRTKMIRNRDFSSGDFYQKCYDYFALGCPPFVPISETREVMRIISECRRDAGW